MKIRSDWTARLDNLECISNNYCNKDQSQGSRKDQKFDSMHEEKQTAIFVCIAATENKKPDLNNNYSRTL